MEGEGLEARQPGRPDPDSHSIPAMAEGDPALGPAPEGLSARRVEHWLDLPAGAWQKRRLYGLRVRTASYEGLGVRSGDIVVVEPGAREQPGQLVVVRTSSALALRRLPGPRQTDRRMPTVLELPLRERGEPEPGRVTGTVIGLLRETGTGALRPVPLGDASRPAARRALRADVRRTPRIQGPAPRPVRSSPMATDLFSTRGQWHDWVERNRSVGDVPGERLARWQRLDASLSSLCRCLAASHSPGLRSALLEESSAVLEVVRREMASR